MDSSIQNINDQEFDHREIAKKLQLFSFHEEGPGFPFFLANGLAIKNELIELWRKEHRLAGYEEIQSPLMLDVELWKKSGHYDLYRDNMYFSEIEKREFAIKPMNCPGAILRFLEKKRSHSELPLRVCELGQVHRDEFSGALHGLKRVRSFMVDDAHLFCSKEQVFDEVVAILQLAVKILNRCGFSDFEIELSVRDEKKKNRYLGHDEEWASAERSLIQALDACKLPYSIGHGEAKFYGPAIDLKIKDNQNRLWQCSSIQLDFNLGQRFSLRYFDDKGNKQSPWILHRCIYGSLERFIAVLLEHHQGHLPFWLAPVQAEVLLVEQGLSIEPLLQMLEERRIRYSVNRKKKSLADKIKDSRSKNSPYMIIVGPRDWKHQKVSVRSFKGDQHADLSLDQLVKLLK